MSPRESIKTCSHGASSNTGWSTVDRLLIRAHSDCTTLNMYGCLFILGLTLTLVVGDRHCNPNAGIRELLAHCDNLIEVLRNIYEPYWNHTGGTSRLISRNRYLNRTVGDPEMLARYPNFIELISKTYELYWNYTEGTSRLYIAVRVKTTGWVGLGVSEKGSMVNSDLAVGWVTDEGEPQIQVQSHLYE